MPTILRKTHIVREIAAILGVSIPTAYALCASEGFPAIRIGQRKIVIPIDAFDRWLDEQTTAPKQ